MKRKYESLILLKPDSPQEKTQGVLDKIQNIIETNDGFIIDIDNWGKKKLAYEVQKQSKGLYLLYTYLAPGGLIQELERNLRINQEVMKFLTVLLEEKVDEESEKTRAEELRKAKAEAEAKAAEALEQAVAEQANELKNQSDEKEEAKSETPEDSKTEKPAEESESKEESTESDDADKDSEEEDKKEE